MRPDIATRFAARLILATEISVLRDSVVIMEAIR